MKKVLMAIAMIVGILLILISLGFIDVSHGAQPKKVVFVGSSSIARWNTLQEDFPNIQVINRGINKRGDRGALISDLSVENDITPFHPDVVVIYAGENDLWSGKSPGQVSCAVDEFIGKIHEAEPGARIIVIGIKTAPMRQEKQAAILFTNRFIRFSCQQSGICEFLTVHLKMLVDGEPNPVYFDEDDLHLNRRGYELWRDELRPLLQ